jgi:signal transduction histidine kinase
VSSQPATTPERDGSELNHVRTNLRGNAIDAAGEGGRSELATRRDGSCAVVEVTDDGPGIPEGIRPFAQTRSEARPWTAAPTSTTS